ncbi:MAG: protoporphyrinogen oxidase [Acidobacteria bacterium]|uniref:Coproporphyrinogen III oxidase n=1 Tax=Candidatus Polarisedimenticola svalbardensis TaxID=2886004 RepID=A0A8J6XT29_9BACT|nr:protoporphyrinogen oxidase [Candidatus Polarisedimenticola svalbardensis]
MPKTVAVIGGGVAGLTVAYELQQYARHPPDGVRAICLEASDRAGGNIRTHKEAGYTCEWGPNGYLDNVPATPALVRRLGLSELLQQADEQAAIRYIYRAGALREAPTGAGAFLKSGILSPLGKLRLLGEPFARKRPGSGDESVYDFAARRIGSEAAEVLVGAMVNGVYAGNVRELCLKSTFPKMYAMETDHGSLFKAMLAKKKTKSGKSDNAGPAGPGGVLTSFRPGLETLIQGLVKANGNALRLNTPVQAISDMGSRGFRVLLESGPPLDVQGVVLACPARAAEAMVREMDPVMADAMGAIPSSPLAVIHLGYNQAALDSMPRGFGFLAPRGQGVRILGCLWSSNIFPGRAPKGKVLLTAMIGGAEDTGVMDLPDAKLVELARHDIQITMGIGVAPEFVKVFRHAHGIPQYTLGHQDRLRIIKERLEKHPGLLVGGNSYGGIAVNHCVEEAPGLADELVRHLES